MAVHGDTRDPCDVSTGTALYFDCVFGRYIKVLCIMKLWD